MAGPRGRRLDHSNPLAPLTSSQAAGPLCPPSPGRQLAGPRGPPLPAGSPGGGGRSGGSAWEGGGEAGQWRPVLSCACADARAGACSGYLIVPLPAIHGRFLVTTVRHQLCLADLHCVVGLRHSWVLKRGDRYCVQFVANVVMCAYRTSQRALTRVRKSITPFQPHRADAGAARTSPGRSHERVSVTV